MVFESPFGPIEFTASVIERFHSNRQRHFWSCETGGQLFGRIEGDRTRVEWATGPGPGSRRGRYHFWPLRAEEQLEIRRMYRDGLHYLGDWHTHAERCPVPSRDDIEKITEIFGQSKHSLRAMVMVIVGTSELSTGLWVGIANTDGVRRIGQANGDAGEWGRSD